jgi:hypothetical protein
MSSLQNPGFELPAHWRQGRSDGNGVRGQDPSGAFEWKIPNDYASVRKMQINATPIVLADSAITRQIKKMAKAASGKEETMAKAQASSSKKKAFVFF